VIPVLRYEIAKQRIAELHAMAERDALASSVRRAKAERKSRRRDRDHIWVGRPAIAIGRLDDGRVGPPGSTSPERP
jgi:hypothetical protein